VDVPRKQVHVYANRMKGKDRAITSNVSNSLCSQQIGAKLSLQKCSVAMNWHMQNANGVRESVEITRGPASGRALAQNKTAGNQWPV